MKYLNKKTIIVMNKLALNICKTKYSHSDNLRGNLGFIEQIYENICFGEKIYPDIFHQAAAYMFYIIKNHVFFDGNKRTGLAAAITFLQINGIEFLPFNEDKVFDFVVSITDGPNDPQKVIPKISNWLKEMSVY